MLGWVALRKLFERIGLLDDEDDSFWGSVPREQWGRFVEGGSLTKVDQQDSIDDVREQAERYREFER